MRALPSAPAVIALLLVGPWAAALPAQEKTPEQAQGRFSVSGYAVANYYRFDWQTDPSRRNTIDLERLAIEPSYLVNNWLRFDAEIEFEHGGTGVTVEFDPFEEFGEFETEIEKGGAVEVEKLQAVFTLKPAFNVRVGRIYVPVGLTSSHDEPDEYFTNTRHETEIALIPTLWHETGIAVFGGLGRARYQALLVTGLDATGFSSANWIVGGWQKRFSRPMPTPSRWSAGWTTASTPRATSACRDISATARRTGPRPISTSRPTWASWRRTPWSSAAPSRPAASCSTGGCRTAS